MSQPGFVNSQLQVKSRSKTGLSLGILTEKQELKLSAHHFAATNKPPSKPLGLPHCCSSAVAAALLISSLYDSREEA